MIEKQRAARLACLLVAFTWSTAAQAQTMFALSPGPGNTTGGQLQIGTGLPLPVGTAGIFTGGMTPASAGIFPPLFVPERQPGLPIMQNQSTAQGGQLTLPAGVLSYMADGVPDYVGVFNTNPVVFQVATTINYSWPSAAAVLAPGGGPGPAAFPGPAGGIIVYDGGIKGFGGPAQFAIAAGPGSGSYAVPAQGAMLPIATVFLNLGGVTPFLGMSVALVGASNPFGVAQQGAPVAAPPVSTTFGMVPMALRTINQPLGGGLCTMWCVTGNGAVGFTMLGNTWNVGPGGAASGPTNMATGTEGFPFTTGLVTISAPAAAPPEIFYAKGSDMRVAGVGNISLVAGSLSQRMLSGPNANRAWVSLPEPAAALGAAGAFGVLALCRSLLRRRSR